MADKKEIIVMDDPLGVDKETLVEFGIEDDISPVEKLSFLQAQLGEFRQQAWRERVNVIHARRLQQSDIEALRLKGTSNLSEHKNTVARLAEGSVMTKKLIEQLRAEYPELQIED
jgi:hypothetical protein